MPDEKQYLSSNSPRAQERYLLLVTRLTVDSCIPIASATWRSVGGRICAPPCSKQTSCCSTIALATLTIVRWRWSSARRSTLHPHSEGSRVGREVQVRGGP